MWLGRGRPRLFRGQQRFSLIEVLAAVVMLAAIGVAFMATIGPNSTSSRIIDQQIVGMKLTTTCMETPDRVRLVECV